MVYTGLHIIVLYRLHHPYVDPVQALELRMGGLGQSPLGALYRYLRLVHIARRHKYRAGHLDVGFARDSDIVAQYEEEAKGRDLDNVRNWALVSEANTGNPILFATSPSGCSMDPNCYVLHGGSGTD